MFLKTTRRVQRGKRTTVAFSLCLLTAMFAWLSVFKTPSNHSKYSSVKIAVAVDSVDPSDSEWFSAFCEVVDWFFFSGHDISIHVRRGAHDTDVTNRLSSRFKGAKLVVDDRYLTSLREKISTFSAVISHLSLGSIETSSVPKLVSDHLEAAVSVQLHVVLVSNLDFLNCAVPGEAPSLHRECEQISRDGLNILEDPFSHKVFVSEDDLQAALRTCRITKDFSLSMTSFFSSALDLSQSLKTGALVLRTADFVNAGPKEEQTFLVGLHKTCEECLLLDKCVRACDHGRGGCGDGPYELSVFAAVKGTDAELNFLEGYVDDILRQDFHLRWEVVISSTASHHLSVIAKRVWDRRNEVSNHLCIRLVHMRLDPGLYETWDYLVREHTRGNVLQNWNVDDRKHKAALRVKHMILMRQSSASLVSSSVVVSSVPNEIWSEARDHHDKQVWFNHFTGYYGLFSLFQHESGMIASNNYPHNSPMYKRSLHTIYGDFAEKWQAAPLRLDLAPTCSDYHFWTKPLKAGETYFHIGLPVELYFLRRDSHNRRSGQRESEECVRQVASQCLPSFDMKLSYELLPLGRRVLIFFNSEKLDGSGTNEERVLTSAVLKLVQAGFRLLLTFSAEIPTMFAQALPHNVGRQKLDAHENSGGVFWSAILFGDPYHRYPELLRKAGFFLSHSSIQWASKADEFASICETLLRMSAR